MRMMLKAKINTEHGNRAIKDGSIQKIMEATIKKLKPEAAYFAPDDGCRSMMIVFDMKDPSDIPQIVEPLFMAFNAEVDITPVMNADDLKRGLESVKQRAR